MLELRLEDVADLVTIASGDVRADAVSMFAIVKDEMDLLPSFLEHYRGLGFSQFLIFDDQSTDGGRAFLEAQDDVVLFTSHLTFGQPVMVIFPDGTKREDRAGIYFKAAIPHVYCGDQIVGYFDADEFLFLPPDITIHDVLDRMNREGADCAVASVVEFFPEAISGLSGQMPNDFAGLLDSYPCFEPEQLVKLRKGQDPELINLSKTNRLFEEYNVLPRIEGGILKRLFTSRRDRKAQLFQKSPRHKIPLVRRSNASWQIGSHYCNQPPSDSILLTIGHFVFTARFAEKIARAQEWKAHTSGASKYRYYNELLSKMQAEDGRFVGPDTLKFESPQQFLDCGLMRW